MLILLLILYTELVEVILPPDFKYVFKVVNVSSQTPFI